MGSLFVLLPLVAIVALEGSKNGALAQDFVDLVLSDTGRGILEEAGFAQP